MSLSQRLLIVLIQLFTLHVRFPVSSSLALGLCGHLCLAGFSMDDGHLNSFLHFYISSALFTDSFPYPCIPSISLSIAYLSRFLYHLFSLLFSICHDNPSALMDAFLIPSAFLYLWLFPIMNIS